jgi:hypothetical protein
VFLKKILGLLWRYHECSSYTHDENFMVRVDFGERTIHYVSKKILGLLWRYHECSSYPRDEIFMVRVDFGERTIQESIEGTI